MRFRRALFFCLLSIAPVFGAHADAPQRVLFLGNSFTYVHGVPELVRALALRQAPDAPPPVVDMIVAGGITLAQILEQDSIPEVFEKGRYDTVVLQERGGMLVCLSSAQRPRPPDCSESIASHRTLAKLARKHGAQRVLIYGTWSNSENMQGSVSRGTRMVGSMVKAEVVDVGAMLEHAAKSDVPLDLMYPDKHLRPAGAMLAAIALYEAMFERRVSAGEFRTEIPVYHPHAPFSPRRPVSMQRRLPKPEPQTIALDAAQMAALLDAAHR